MSQREGWTGVRCGSAGPPTRPAGDALGRYLSALGLGWQLGTSIAISPTESAVFTFERLAKDGPHDPILVDLLDEVRPHLARAGVMTARLGVERARAMTDALALVGLPAAVLDEAGCALAANQAFGDLKRGGAVPAPGAFQLSDPRADLSLKAALRDDRHAERSLVRSVPMMAPDGQPAYVIHILPLRGAARDMFTGARSILVAARIGQAAAPPSAQLLDVLFRLTPSEAGLARSLVEGLTLSAFATRTRISVETARTHLRHVLAKTGTNRQAELVLLLRGLQAVA